MLPVDAAADEAGQKGFAVRQRRASPEDSTDDSAEKPDASVSAEAHRKPRLWWAADGWWLEWPQGGCLLAETAVGIYPAAEPYLSLHGQDEDEREERSLRAAALFAAAEVLGLTASAPIKPQKLVLPKKPAALPLRPSRELEAAFLTAAAQSRLSPEQHQNRARAVKALSESPETETSGSGADSARTANELWGARQSGSAHCPGTGSGRCSTDEYVGESSRFHTAARSFGSKTTQKHRARRRQRALLLRAGRRDGGR